MMVSFGPFCCILDIGLVLAGKHSPDHVSTRDGLGLAGFHFLSGNGWAYIAGAHIKISNLKGIFLMIIIMVLHFYSTSHTVPTSLSTLSCERNNKEVVTDPP